MVELQGKSGVRHAFSEVETSGPDEVAEDRNLIIESVAEVLESVVTVTEVIALYAKALDVGAREVSLEAPSFEKDALELAAGYGIQAKKR